MQVESFAYSESPTAVLAEEAKLRAFSLLTRKAAPLFVQGGDYISALPMVSGVWEPAVAALLTTLAADGYGAALFDIGANIGLSTFAAAHSFGITHCFEPNPRLFHVLAANLYHHEHVKLHNIGLGRRDEERMLLVPSGNMAGGFVQGAGNAYSERDLAAKDGLPYVDACHQLPIQLRQGRAVLQPLFPERPFAIKIDAEGFEQTILKEIAAALPPSSRVAIIFENLLPDFDPRRFYAETFGRPSCRLLKLESNVNQVSTHWRKRIEAATRGRRYGLVEHPKRWIGTVVYLID